MLQCAHTAPFWREADGGSQNVPGGRALVSQRAFAREDRVIERPGTPKVCPGLGKDFNLCGSIGQHLLLIYRNYQQPEQAGYLLTPK